MVTLLRMSDMPRLSSAPARREARPARAQAAARSHTRPVGTSGLGRRAASMRWWLALAFAAIAALTAVLVAEFFTQRADSAFRSRAEELAAGSAVAAAATLHPETRAGTLSEAVAAQARARRLTLFVFDSSGRLLDAAGPRRTRFAEVPARQVALATALAGRRYVMALAKGKTIVVALPLHMVGATALIAVASRPDLVADFGILHDKIVEAALWAVLAGVLAGFVIAVGITTRLRRVARAAGQIEQGRFDIELRPRFRDELGELAATVDRMRQRLKASFESLEAERDRLQRLLEQLQEGVIAVDAGLDVEFANGAAAELLGGCRLEHGAPLPEPWPGFSLRDHAAELFLPGSSTSQTRVSATAETTLVVTGIPPVGSGTAVLVVADVTEQERRERAEREFVANASHELRTPLAAIGGALEVLRLGAKEVPEERDRFLALIERQTSRLGRLSRALLTLARAQTREEPILVEPVELAPLLAEVAGGLALSAGVEVEVRCAPGVSVMGHAALLESAIANLSTNAVKHTPHGKVVLSAAPRSARSVAIEVSDTGSGIAADDRERVFDRFYSGGNRDGSSREGFGLGLAIVREAVRGMGGSIELSSSPGAGTTVSVVLPSARDGVE